MIDATQPATHTQAIENKGVWTASVSAGKEGEIRHRRHSSSAERAAPPRKICLQRHCRPLPTSQQPSVLRIPQLLRAQLRCRVGHISPAQSQLATPITPRAPARPTRPHQHRGGPTPGRTEMLPRITDRPPSIIPHRAAPRHRNQEILGR